MRIRLRDARLRHTRFYLEYAQIHRANVQALSRDLPNIKEALDRCLQDGEWELAADFVDALSTFWVQRGPWEEYLRYGRLLISDPASLSRSKRSRLLGRLAAVEELIGNYAEAASLYKSQLDILDHQETGDQEDLGHVFRQLSKLASRRGDFPETESMLTRSLEIARTSQNTKEEVDVLFELSGLRRAVGDLEVAESLAQEGFEKARSIHYVRGMIETLKLHGSTRWTRNRLAEAKASYLWALEISLDSGDRLNATQLRELLSRLEAALEKGIFISYNHRDRPFVERLAQDLKGSGLAVWFDEWEIKVGDSIVQKVSKAVDRSAYLAVVLSPDSVQSAWVQVELGSALMRRLSTERSVSILPLLIADCQIPALIRDLKWADFRRDYDTGLRSLLDVLAPKPVIGNAGLPGNNAES